jgi:hypothetical protein
MATQNNQEFKSDKTTEISFYVMFGGLSLGFILLVFYLIYGFLA